MSHMDHQKPPGRADRTREQALSAAARVLSMRPGSSLQDIADEACIGRATLHRYFPTRDELVRALAADAIGRTAEAIREGDLMRGPASEALRRLVGALMPLGDRFHYLLHEPFLESDPEIAEASERLFAPISELLRRGQEQGAFRADLSVAWSATLFESTLYAAWLAIHKGDLAPNQATDVVMRTLIGGLGSERRT